MVDLQRFSYPRLSTVFSRLQVSSPFESLLVTILAIFYVDDGMPGVNDSLEASAIPLQLPLTQAEQATQSWEKLLFTPAAPWSCQNVLCM